mmetsp:Transcript_2106/g.6072  ORF Transcript_2106/g.6072 Transcript_2106/m.6072 type:complete len:541 (-) Transcript_2106:211-1833(-)
MNLVSLGIRVGSSTDLVIFNDGLIDILQERGKRIGRIGLGQVTTLKVSNKSLGDGIKVALLDHFLGLGILNLIKRLRQLISHGRLSISCRIPGCLHHLLGKCRGSIHNIANLYITSFLLDKADEVHLLLDKIRKLFDRLRLQMLLIDPPELVHIKDGRTLDNTVNIKCLNELISRENFVFGTVVPSQQGEVVDHGIGQESIELELVARGGAVTLGELLLVLTQDEGAMRISRTRSTKSIEDEALPQGVGKMLLGANDGGDAHAGIIDGDTEVVNRYARRTEEDKVTDGGFSIPGYSSADSIFDDDTSVGGNLEADGVRGTFGHLLRHEVWISIAPSAVVSGGHAFCLLLGLHLLELLLGAEAGIGLAFVNQLLGELGIDLIALGLTVGTILGKRHVWAFVPVQSEPLQISENRLLTLLGRSSKISILHAQNECTIIVGEIELTLLRNKPIVQSSTGSTNVKTSSRTGSESHPGSAILNSLSSLGEGNHVVRSRGRLRGSLLDGGKHHGLLTPLALLLKLLHLGEEGVGAVRGTATAADGG